MAKTKEKFHDPNQQKFANIKGFSLVAPAVFLISLFTVYPIIFTLYWAFHSGNLISPDSKYVGMNNFRYLFSTPSFLKVLMNTVFYSVIVVLKIFPFIKYFVFYFIPEFLYHFIVWITII